MISYRDLQAFMTVAQSYLKPSPESPARTTKLAYALNRVMAKCHPIHERISDLTMDLYLEHALTDPKDGRLIKDKSAQHYEETKPEAKLRVEALRTLYQTSDIDIPTHFVTTPPTDLSELELENFVGIVITEDQVSAIRKIRDEESADDDKSPEPPTAITPADILIGAEPGVSMTAF